jgi:hypothetical protein
MRDTSCWFGSLASHVGGPHDGAGDCSCSSFVSFIEYIRFLMRVQFNVMAIVSYWELKLMHEAAH